MKNKKIILGSLLAVFVLVMMPSIDAIEYKNTKSVYEKNSSICTQITNESTQYLQSVEKTEKIKDGIFNAFQLGILSSIQKFKFNHKVNIDAPQPNCLEDIIDWLIELLVYLLTNTPLLIAVISLIIGVGAGMVLGLAILISIINEEPSMTFNPDYHNKTITVDSVEKRGALWGFIENTGTGTCQKPNLDIFVTNEDIITNCSGEITLTYLPTQTELATYIF